MNSQQKAYQLRPYWVGVIDEGGNVREGTGDRFACFADACVYAITLHQQTHLPIFDSDDIPEGTTGEVVLIAKEQ